MSNLRLWGYTSNNGSQSSVPMGLLEKINKLKTELNKLRENLDNEDTNNQLDELELILNEHVQELDEFSLKVKDEMKELQESLSNLPYSSIIERLQQQINTFIEKYTIFKTETNDKILHFD